jgi:polar amino acid transport system substrate-binding protein
MPFKRLPRIDQLIVFLTAICLLLASCQEADRSWERVSESGVLRVGLDPTFPPFEVADEQGLRGLDVDLAHALAEDLGLKPEFVHFGYDGLYDALATGQVDVLISALVVVPERTRDFAYSQSYFNAGEILIVPQSEQTLTGMEDLNGRILAVELGALGHVEATAWARQLPDLTVQTYDSVDAALNAVATEEADAGLVDAVNGRLYLAQQAAAPPDQNFLNRLPEPVTVEPYALVVRIDDQMLLEKLDQSLGKLITSSQLEIIVKRWLGP